MEIPAWRKTCRQAQMRAILPRPNLAYLARPQRSLKPWLTSLTKLTSRVTRREPLNYATP